MVKYNEILQPKKGNRLINRYVFLEELTYFLSIELVVSKGLG